MKAIVVFYPTIMKSFKKSDHVKVCNGDVCIEADGAAGQIKCTCYCYIDHSISKCSKSVFEISQCRLQVSPCSRFTLTKKDERHYN